METAKYNIDIDEWPNFKKPTLFAPDAETACHLIDEDFVRLYKWHRAITAEISKIELNEHLLRVRFTAKWGCLDEKPGCIEIRTNEFVGRDGLNENLFEIVNKSEILFQFFISKVSNGQNPISFI